MELSLIRQVKTDNSTIGSLYIDGVFECYTLEDKDRGLSSQMPEALIKDMKVKGETAIPTGTYSIDMDTVSPRFSSSSSYKSIGGKLPRLVGVKGFDGVLIHIGNYPKDTDGCILVGTTKATDSIGNSKVAFNALYDKLKGANTITLVIQ